MKMEGSDTHNYEEEANRKAEERANALVTKIEIIDDPFYCHSNPEEVEYILKYSTEIGDFDDLPGLEDKIRSRQWGGGEIFQYKAADGSWKNTDIFGFNPYRKDRDRFIKRVVLSFARSQISSALEKNQLQIKEKIKEMSTELLALLEDYPILLKNLLEEKYKLLIGTDVGGRLPALLMKRVAEELGAHPEMSFLAGSGVYSDSAISRVDLPPDQYLSKVEEIGSFLAERNIGEGDKVLIIEDVLVTGASIKPLCEAVHNAKVSLDLVTMRVHQYASMIEPDRLAEIQDELKIKDVFYAEIANNGYFAHSSAGVSKDAADVFSSINEGVDPTEISEAREQINQIAEIIAELIKPKN